MVKGLWAVIGLAAWVGFADADPPPATAEPSPLQQPEHFRSIDELVGRVEAVDVANGSLVVRDDIDRTWRIKVTPDTQFTDKDNARLTAADLKKDDQLHIYYNASDLRARQVDRVALPFPASLLDNS